MPVDTPDTHYDAIVIGSGMGGLATASLLAQVGGKRVLVLEAHFKLGGFLHSFQRHGYLWDPGVHYIGEMAQGSLTRQCMDLVTGQRVQWHKISDHFERFVFPEGTFEVPSDPVRHRERLKELFPAEAAGIDRYFKDLKATQDWSFRWFYSKCFGWPVNRAIAFGDKLARTVTQDHLDRHLSDPLLKAILTAQWPDYGTIPSRSAFGVHAVVATDFQNGGYYPVGGSQEIADSAAAIIEAHGGRCLVKHPVTDIIIRNNRAIGVRVTNRQGTTEYFAPAIISDAGVHTTFTSLVDPQHATPERQRLARSEPGTSAALLFLGLSDDPRNHGFDDANYWIYDSVDHNEPPKSNQFPPVVEGAFLSFGSLRNPGQEPHTAQIVTFSNDSDWLDLANGRPWKKRGIDYDTAKAQYSRDLLEFVDKRVSRDQAGRLTDIVAYHEMATPLTFRSFTGHTGGQVYGRACTPARVGRDQWSIGTSIKGLYLTGTDLVVPGVNSALMIGAMTAGKLLGPIGIAKVVHRARTPRKSGVA